MSISLVHLRIAITNKKELSSDISYTASQLSLKSEVSRSTYAEVLAQPTRPVGSELKDLNQKCIGHRRAQEICIESYFPQEQMDLEPLSDKETKKFEKLEEKRDAANDHRSEVPGSSRKPVVRSRSKKSSVSSHDGISFSGVTEDECARSTSAKMRPGSHSPILANTIHFFAGNPGVERTEGIIHLYKDNQMTPLKEDVPRSEMICMLAVPARLTSREILKFLAPMELYIEHMRIIRDATPNQYMVLVKFKSQKYADEFYNAYNNMPFNSIEPEICHLIYVAKVETVKDSEGAGLPIPGLTELPTCPVCLERMDESVDGILTILCNHSFHGSCLAQWGDTSCPVCRYLQTPEPVADNKCLECDSQESLWICLICGHVGCGRYVEGHAYQHFIATSHTYSMQLGSQRVWDYAGDNYVHRLVQNKSDGKLVEVDEGGNPVEEEKLDSLTLEYTYLLTSQLESQRTYFEEKMEMIEKEAVQQLEEAGVKSKKALEECDKMERKLTTVSKEKTCQEKKLAQVSSKVNKLMTELEEEKEMNKCLQENQAQWQKKVSVLEGVLKAKDKENKELQEQLRDLMFYLEAQEKLSTSAEVSQEELQEGHIVVGASAKPRRKKTR